MCHLDIPLLLEISPVTEHFSREGAQNNEQNGQDPCCYEAYVTEGRATALVGDRLGAEAETRQRFSMLTNRFFLWN